MLARTFFILFLPRILHDNDMMDKKLLFTTVLASFTLAVSAQVQFNQPHGLYEQKSLTVEMTGTNAGMEIR